MAVNDAVERAVTECIKEWILEDFFYRAKDEVALLWQPHPLMESTVKSILTLGS